MPNVQAIVDHLRRLEEQYPATVPIAVQRVFLEILSISKKECPVETGYLRGTGYVSEPVSSYGQFLISIGYSAGYSWWVHELIANYHHPPTKAKFLEEPLQMYAKNIPMAITNEINRLVMLAGA